MKDFFWRRVNPLSPILGGGAHSDYFQKVTDFKECEGDSLISIYINDTSPPGNGRYWWYWFQKLDLALN